MKKRIAMLAVVCLLFLGVEHLAAHQDRIGPLTRVVKEYAAPKPLGTIRVTYSVATQPSTSAATQPAARPSLHVECDLFKAEVPSEGLEDLPRPDWSRLETMYSLTSYDAVSGKSVERPYVYVQVPLLGPSGKETWVDTWATFHFNQEKSFRDRQIERSITLPKVNGVPATRSIWNHWPIGKGISAEEALKASEN